MKNILISVMALFCISSFSVNAAPVQITIESATMSAKEADLKAFWDAVDPSNITNEGTFSVPTGILFSGGNANNKTIFRLSFDFNSANVTVIDFFAGLDAGFGAELFLNNANIFDTEDDLWWGRNPNNGDVISQSIEFGSGQNELVLFWAEGFNSGGNQIDIKVSAPAMLSIFALGLVGLVLTRRK